MNPSLRAEALAVEAGHEHGLVAPVAGAAPYGDADFVPSAGHNGVFTFRAVYAKKLGGHMVGVGGPYRHYHHARPYIELRYEGFLQPELLEGNFAPTLYLRLVFASFLVLEFHGAFGASVLEFYFRTERPPLPKS